MHINFSIDGEEITSPEQRQAFAAVLRAVAETLANGQGAPVVTGFRPELAVPETPSTAPGRVTPLATADDPYEEKPKRGRPKKTESVPDSKDPAQTSIPRTEPTKGPEPTRTAPAAVPDADALRAIVNKYTNRFGLAKLRETVTAYGVKKLIELTDTQKVEWAAKRNEELAAPAAEEN